MVCTLLGSGVVAELTGGNGHDGKDDEQANWLTSGLNNFRLNEYLPGEDPGVPEPSALALMAPALMACSRCADVAGNAMLAAEHTPRAYHRVTQSETGGR